MNLPEICLRRPVLAIVLSLLLAVLGVLGFSKLEITPFPNVTLPIVSIKTTFDGASAELMESQVSTIIENALAGVNGVSYIESSSSQSYSVVTVQFSLGGDLEAEASEVRDKVAAAAQDLPADADDPIISVGVDASPLMAIGFTDDKKEPVEIRDYLLNTVQPMLRQLPGVGGVSTQGSSSYAMRIWLDSAKMAARNITVTDVKNAITANNIYFPAGAFYGKARNYSIKSDTTLKTPGEFSNIIIKQTAAGPIKIKDVANVELGLYSLYDYPLRISGKSGVLLVISPLQSYNPLTVAKEVHAALPSIKKALPDGMHAEITFDDSTYLQNSIMETFRAIAEAVVLVIIIVLIFLGSLRAAIIPIVTIPVSLIGVFFIMQLLGFTINMLSLLGMVLAIGLVVDDAIVMLENIHRHIEVGEEPFEAALKGSREIAGAIMVMTLTLVAVYAPLGFMTGFTAVLFKEFAFTLAGSVVISGFIALTLSPMMSAKLLKREDSESRVVKFIEHIFDKMTRAYQKLLARALRHRLIIILILLGIAAAGTVLFMHMSSEFIPQEDNGRIAVSMRSPTGSSIDYTDDNAKLIGDILTKDPDVESYTSQVTVTTTNIVAVLKPWGIRKTTSKQIVTRLNKRLAEIPGVVAVASIPDAVDFGEQGSDITLNFLTAGEYSDLAGPISTVLDDLNNYPGIMNVDSSLKFDSQQYTLNVNRDLAANVGVNMQDIADTIHSMMSGIHTTNVQSGNRLYQVKLQMQKSELMSFDSMNRIYINGKSLTGESNMIPLSSLITLTPHIDQGTLHHYNRMRSGAITGLVAPGYTESEVIQHINSILPAALTTKVRTEYSGKAQQFIDSSGSIQGIMVLSFVFIYLVLSAQFGSFIDPFIILLAVPLSMVGALFSLWLGGGTFNLYSQIGLVTLVGLISKHGILITKFINDLREQGVEFNQAILEGASIRFRPILMTTSAMVFGALPLALASGLGSVGREQIGWTIVGGLIFGTFFSLIVVPVAYSFLGKFKKITHDPARQ